MEALESSGPFPLESGFVALFKGLQVFPESSLLSDLIGLIYLALLVVHIVEFILE